MAKNRVIYQVKSLYAGPSISTGILNTTGSYGASGSQLITATRINEIKRVQSADTSFNIVHRDVNQLGELAAIDRIILEQPTVNLNFTYLQANMANEARLGFTVSSGVLTSALSGILTQVSDDRNYFLKVVPEGNDNAGNVDTSSSVSVVGIGNGFMSSFSTQGSVGNFPQTTIGVEGLNMAIQSSTGGVSPAVFPTDGSPVSGWFYSIPVGTQNPGGVAAGDLATSVIRPGDINVSFGTYNDLGAAVSDVKVQSYTIDFNLNRENLQKLGSKYAFSKQPVFPVVVNASFSALAGDLATGNLINTINADNSYNLSVTLNKPGTSVPMAQYVLRGAKLDSQDGSLSIGSNETVNFRFSAQIGGPQATGQGFYISGSN